jgi:hypothetical protein
MPMKPASPMCTPDRVGTICSSLLISRNCSTARAANAAMADIGGRLAVEFPVGVVERVLEHRGQAAVAPAKVDELDL